MLVRHRLAARVRGVATGTVRPIVNPLTLSVPEMVRATAITSNSLARPARPVPNRSLRTTDVTGPALASTAGRATRVPS